MGSQHILLSYFSIIGNKNLLCYAKVHGGTGTRKLIFGYLETAEKWVEDKLNKAFLHFFQIFGIYLMIFQSFAAPSAYSTLKNHQIYQTFGKKWRKFLFN